jgi:speckle-type POZ protein
MANRIVLAKYSPVFKMMLQTDMIEAKTKELHLSDIDSLTMREFINFLYSGKVNSLDEVAYSLLNAAEKYQVIGLKYVCITHLRKILSAESVFETLQIAYLLGITLLYEECIGFIFW